MAEEIEQSTETTAPEPQAAAPESTPMAAPAPVAAPAEQWDDIRDYAKGQGLDLTHLHSSDEAAKYLINLARSNDAYANYGRQLAPHYDAFQKFLGSQQQAPAQPAAQVPNYFNLPDYDPRWLDWLERDAAGNVVPKVGAPPDVLGKVVQYQAKLREFQDSFYREPQRYLQPLIKDTVGPLVQDAIGKQLQDYQDRIFATNFVAQNSQWLHYRDPQGQIIRDPVTGGFAMTPEGQLFLQHMTRAQNMGIRGLQDQQAFAMDQMRLSVLMAQQNQAGAAQQRQTQDQQFLQQHNRRVPNHQGSIDNGALSQNPGLSLADRMRQALVQGGVTDAELIHDVR